MVAEISFSLPGGDAYQPQAAACDEAGRVAVVCYDYGAATSGLALLDAQQGRRGAVWPLPGRSLGPLAAGGGYAYLGYEDGERQQHLAAVSLQTGQVAADVVTSEFLYYGDTLVADPAGRLYTPLRDRLEVRDGATLQVVSSLPYGGTPQERALAADLDRDRLYLAVGEVLRAYRASDLRLLWEAPGLTGRLSLVTDQAGRRVYVRCEAYQDGQLTVRLLAFDAATGSALGAVQTPQGSGWQLIAADSEAGYLAFAGSQGNATLLWQTQLDGRPNGVSATIANWASGYVARDGLLLALVPGDHEVRVYDLAGLRLRAAVPTGIEIRNVLADPDHERAYVNDSAGRVHAVDTQRHQVLASVAAGRGALALDAANSLLFVSREVRGSEVAVLSTSPLTVTATITGGYKVAIDAAGRRAFVGWTELRSPTPGVVQIWDTRTFERIGSIAHRGEPAYNPLRDEIYLQDYSAYVVDGKSLEVIGELTPDIGETPEGLQGCNGCVRVTGITVDAASDAIVVSLLTGSTGGGPGTVIQPRLFSARTRQPATHTVTVLSRCCGSAEPFIIPPDEGMVYESQRFRRYVAYNSTLAYPAGAAEPREWRDGLPLDLYLPGTHVGLSAQQGQLLAFDTANWQPLGWLPRYCIGEMDLVGRRLYAWRGAQLTILGFDGAPPLPAPPPEPLPAEARSPGAGVQAIVPSPDFAHDHTVLATDSGQIRRSTDGGARWATLRGGLPPWAPGSTPTISVVFSPGYAQDRTLFAAGYAGEPVGYGVWRSTDGGDTWAPVWQGLEHLRVDRLVLSPRYAEDHTLLAYCQYQEFWRAESGTSLFRSSDGGESWPRLATRPNVGNPAPLPAPEQLLPYPAAPLQWRLAEQRDAIERSTDGGQTWQAVLRRPDPARWPRAVVPSPLYEQDRQVFVLYEDLIYRSTDGGATWQTAGDRGLVRSGFEDHFTTLAVARLGDGVALFVGDYTGAVLALDPAKLRWAAAAAPAPTASPAPQPTVAAVATDTPCSPPLPGLAAAYGRWTARLGCPADAGAELHLAGQRFERGLMLWRSDTRQIYALASDDGGNTWAVYADTWEEGRPDRDPGLAPPADREQPIRGFGTVWREQLGGPQSAVGWAVAGEQAYGGTAQAFSGGLLITGPDGRAYALFGDGSWESQ